MADSSDLGAMSSQRQKGKRVVVSKYTRHACAQCKKAKTKCEGGEPVCDRCLKTGHDCLWVEDNRKALTRHHEQALRHQNGVLKSEVDQLKSELAAIKAQLGTLSLKTESDADNIASISAPVQRIDSNPPNLKSSTHPIPSSSHPLDDELASDPEGEGTSNHPSSSPSKKTVHSLEDAEEYYTDISERDCVASGSGSALDMDGDIELSPQHSSHHVSWKEMGVPSGNTGYDSDGDSEESSEDGLSSDSDCYDSSDLDENDVIEMNRLVRPSKKLFVEYDDLHLYGLTSVFRLRQEHRRRRNKHNQPEFRHHIEHGRPQIRRRTSERTVRSRSRRQSFGAANSVVNFKLANQLPADDSSDGNAHISPVTKRHSKSREKNMSRGEKRVWEKTRKGTGSGRKARKKTRSGTSTQRAPSTSPSRIDLSHVSTKKHVLLLSASQTESPPVVVLSSSPTDASSVSDLPIPTDNKALSQNVPQCECWATCWAQFLPPEILEIMGRVQHDVLLDRTMIFFSSWCMRVVPEYFLRDMYATLHPSTLRQAVRQAPSSSSATEPLPSPAQTQTPKRAHYSPFLHNALLAVATAFSDDPRISSPQSNSNNSATGKALTTSIPSTDIKSKELSPIRYLLAERAKSYIESECARPSVSAVQALSLLASVYSGMGEQTLGFMYFGMSARISQALGLNADYGSLLRTGRIGPREVFDRMWCYHMGASQDACWSLYVGREFGIPMGPDDDPSVLEGLVDPMLDTMAWRQTSKQQQTKLVVSPGLEENTGESVQVLTPQKCGTFSVFLWSCYLMKLSRRIMDLMNRLGKTNGDKGATEMKLLVADIDIQLIAWREELPHDLKLLPSNESTALPHKLMMHLAYWWLLILLHRPFYRRRGIAAMDLTFSVNRCDLAAREILSLLRLWKKIYGTIRFTPITMIQIAFASGTIYVMAAIQAGTGRRPAVAKQLEALHSVKEIIELLKEMGGSWGAATKIASVFTMLVGEVERGIEAKTEGRRERKRRRTKTVTEATTLNLSAAKSADKRSVVQLLPEIPNSSISTQDTSMIGEFPIPPTFISARPNGAFSPQSDSSPFTFSPESDSPVSFTHHQSGGSGGDMSSASDSESGFLDFHPSSESQYDLIHLYNSFMQNNLDNGGISGMDIDVSNLPGMNFGPNPGFGGEGFSFDFMNNMPGGEPGAYVTQPAQPSLGLQGMGLTGFSGITDFGAAGPAVQFNSFSTYDGVWGGTGESSFSTSGRVNHPPPREQSRSGSMNFDLNDLTSDGEDRALMDMILSLGNEYSHQSS